MSMGYWIVQGDKTTCGGTVLTGHPNGALFAGNRQATQGCAVSCGKHSGKYSILGGHPGELVHGVLAASTLYSRSSCPCNAHFIPSQRWAKHGLYQGGNRRQAENTQLEQQQTLTNPAETQSNHQLVVNKDNRIRIDAQNLMDCADDICEKHLYFPDIKAAFRSEIEAFASMIVQQVESGQKSYEQGSAEIKVEEKSLRQQSIDWFLNGMSILGGIGQIWAGGALCVTGGGCFIGAMLITHGTNNIYEGAVGFYEGHSDAQGFLKEGYQTAAVGLGFDKAIGTLAYDLVDLGLSVHGKLKLVPKLNEFKEVEKPLFLKKYARQDMERAYKQSRDALLRFEIVNDVIGITKIRDDIKNAFFLDKKSGEVIMVVSEPEKITNVKQIITDDCERYIVIGDEPSYFLCPDPNDNNSKIKVNYDGDVIE